MKIVQGLPEMPRWLVILAAGIGLVLVCLFNMDEPAPQAATRASGVAPASFDPAVPKRPVVEGSGSGNASPFLPWTLLEARIAGPQVHDRPGLDPFRPPTSLAVQSVKPAPTEPSAQPAAPPLPFAYLGRWIDAGAVTVFLSQGDRNFAVKAGETIDGAWRLEGIEDGQLAFLYLPLQTRQGLRLDEPEPQNN